jgi:hypothetical protein
VVSRALLRSGVRHRNRAQRGSADTPQRAVAEATESAAPRFVGAVAVALPAGLLVQALADHAGYRHPVVPVVVWLGMLAVAAWLMPRASAGNLGNAHAAVAIAVAVAAVTAIGLDRRAAGAAMNVDWTILGVIWLLALLALITPAWVWVPGAALVTGIHSAFVVQALGFSPLGLTRLAASSYAVVSILAVFAALRPALRTHAEMEMHRAALASRLAAERAAVAAIGEVRRDRLALLEMEALPLLRGIADGSLDPSDSAVRQRCAEHAATLRCALVNRTCQPSVLLACLGPVVGDARERNVPVEVQVIGDPGDPGENVVRATVAAVDRVLRALPPQPVILTVLGSGDEAEMYLTFERPPVAGCDVAGLGGAVPPEVAWRAALEAEDGGPGCLEIRWQGKGEGEAGGVPA